MTQIKLQNGILDLSLTYHWFDEIAAGRKKEEYRKYTKYYESRLMNPLWCDKRWKHYDAIRFRRGRFGKKTMLVRHIGTRLGMGRPEWGAPENEDVFVIVLGEIISKSV